MGEGTIGRTGNRNESSVTGSGIIPVPVSSPPPPQSQDLGFVGFDCGVPEDIQKDLIVWVLSFH